MDCERTFKDGSTAFDAGEFPTAAARLLPLADAGHAGAQYLVADMYRWGKGVEQAVEPALNFYRAAADQGHPRAALDLCFLLDPFGRSFPPNMQSAVRDAAASKHYLEVAVVRFKELAEAGDVEAMANLGLLFHHGCGVELNGLKAIEWYTRAFDAGQHGAANGLSLVYYEGDVRERDKDKARFWYMKTKEFDCRFVTIAEFEPRKPKAGKR